MSVLSLSDTTTYKSFVSIRAVISILLSGTAGRDKGVKAAGERGGVSPLQRSSWVRGGTLAENDFHGI